MLVAQSCPTLCNLKDCSLPGSSAHGILQARVLEWVTIPALGDLPNPGTKPRSSALQPDFLLFEPPGKAKTTLHNNKLTKNEFTSIELYLLEYIIIFKNSQYWSIILCIHKAYVVLDTENNQILVSFKNKRKNKLCVPWSMCFAL